MGIPVLILGESGSGKSTSLRNFEPTEVGIFNVASKPLPFRRQLPSANGVNAMQIQSALMHPKANIKTYVTEVMEALANAGADTGNADRFQTK